MSTTKSRDERRREHFIQGRKKRGRPPGLTPVQKHPKRFEAVIWLTYRRCLHYGYGSAGGIAFCLLRFKPPFELFDVGHEYVRWSGRNPFAKDDADGLRRLFHEYQKTADELIKRAQSDPEDARWLRWSTFSLFNLLLNRNESITRLSLEALSLMGWGEILVDLAQLINQLPAAPSPASTDVIQAFQKSMRRHPLPAQEKL